MKFKRIMADNVLLRPQQAQEATVSGIILATSNKEKPAIYEVVAVGPEASELSAGDLVVCSQFVGSEIKLDGEEYKFVKLEDILAVVGD